MTPSGQRILVLGNRHKGFYPIEWSLCYDMVSRDFIGNLMHPEPFEQWRIFGLLTHDEVTPEVCDRILRATERGGRHIHIDTWDGQGQK